MKAWETMPGHRRATAESVREQHNAPEHGYARRNQRPKIMPPDSKEQAVLIWGGGLKTEEMGKRK